MPSPYWKALWDAVHVKSRQEAADVLHDLIARCQSEDPGMSYAGAKEIQLSNIGWFFGELGPEEKKHALEMWPEASHPIFGRELDVDPEAALSAGMVLAQHWNRGEEQSAVAAARKVIEESKHDPPTHH